ncbi:MAG: class I SAM-dependent methyltransferase [Desulfurivibrionaceae bacterium]
MTHRERIKEHYRHGDLLNAILAGIEHLGKTPETVTPDDLAPVDEFHIGGRTASEIFLDQLGFSGRDHLLDVGCGLGGTSRFVADRYQSRITGIDLVKEYIQTGAVLCNWVGLNHLIALQQGDVLNLPFADSTFNGAFMMHVGMNIQDKASLFAEVNRVLRPGALFGIYDVMQTTAGKMAYPVPWASNSSTSQIKSPETYKTVLEETGFAIDSERNRHSYAVKFFEQMQKNAGTSKEPPALGPHILMGDDARVKAENMIANVSSGCIAPVEIIARKR